MTAGTAANIRVETWMFAKEGIEGRQFSLSLHTRERPAFNSGLDVLQLQALGLIF